MVQEWDLVVKVANLECFYRAKVANIVIGRWILGSKLDLGPKVGSDKVGLGPKVGSDQESRGLYGVKVDLGPKVGSDLEKQSFLWSQSGQYSDRKVGLKIGSWANDWIRQCGSWA